MTPSLLLSFDIGTTGNKAALVDTATGAVMDSATATYPTFYTSDGGAEQRPEDWWGSVVTVCREIEERRPGALHQVVGVSCSGMMNGVVALAAQGMLARERALIHADVRSAPQCRALAATLGIEAVFAVTGNRPDPHLSLPKMLWLRDKEPETYARTECFIQAKDYVVGRLSGIWGVTDPSDASLTGAFSVARRVWAVDLLDAVGIPRTRLTNLRQRRCADAAERPFGCAA